MRRSHNVQRGPNWQTHLGQHQNQYLVSLSAGSFVTSSKKKKKKPTPKAERGVGGGDHAACTLVFQWEISLIHVAKLHLKAFSIALCLLLVVGWGKKTKKTGSSCCTLNLKSSRDEEERKTGSEREPCCSPGDSSGCCFRGSLIRSGR